MLALDFQTKVRPPDLWHLARANATHSFPHTGSSGTESVFLHGNTDFGLAESGRHVGRPARHRARCSQDPNTEMSCTWLATGYVSLQIF